MYSIICICYQTDNPYQPTRGASPTKSMTFWNLDWEVWGGLYPSQFSCQASLQWIQDSLKVLYTSSELFSPPSNYRIICHHVKSSLGGSTDLILSLKCRLYDTKMSGSL
jgi:hypothetical protein